MPPVAADQQRLDGTAQHLREGFGHGGRGDQCRAAPIRSNAKAYDGLQGRPATGTANKVERAKVKQIDNASLRAHAEGAQSASSMTRHGEREMATPIICFCGLWIARLRGQ
jgi:hypothetical protein